MPTIRHPSACCGNTLIRPQTLDKHLGDARDAYTVAFPYRTSRKACNRCRASGTAIVASLALHPDSPLSLVAIAIPRWG